MPSLAFAIPLLPGKTEAWKEFVQELSTTKKEEFHQYHLRSGLIRETWFLQSTPNGDMAVVFLEGDLALAFSKLPASTEPFDLWFKEKLKECQGIDYSHPMPGMPAQIMYDSQIN